MDQHLTLNIEPGISSEEIKDMIDRTKEEEEDASPSVMPPPDIVAFNEQRSCADIYRMYLKNQININPDFQRGEVWRNPAQTLFIDSLMKQLPIPSMCISLDISTQKRMVIDGLQRISSIIKFLNEQNDWLLSKNDDVDPRISNKKVSEIKKENPHLVEILENVTIPITVLRCDSKNPEHMKYLFQIFYRLNSGGNKLYNQEIRNCIFQGSFNTLLKELARTPEWYTFANTDQKKVDKARFNNEERILRFFAFYQSYSNYKGKLAAFLNTYMNENKDTTDDNIKYLKDIFKRTLNIANKLEEKIDSKNIAEAVMIGIAYNLTTLTDKDSKVLNKMYEELLKEPKFQPEEMKEGLSSEEKVKSRIESAINVFSRG
ncbi:DUF262 domain-containing protein [Prevotella denticola]|uniref:Protein of uncharacterized function DUF262 n=1 Tax=Prevotella denticola TaxID=28129 RepID=A0A379EE72_9BACT|nr:DUF262 domain-containing protein [Prevotella denticola]SUB94511.1 Protein of uncharacterised function DUF262 [Prevotella denticola]